METFTKSLMYNLKNISPKTDHWGTPQAIYYLWDTVVPKETVYIYICLCVYVCMCICYITITCFFYIFRSPLPIVLFTLYQKNSSDGILRHFESLVKVLLEGKIISLPWQMPVRKCLLYASTLWQCLYCRLFITLIAANSHH